jgi:hypothetical protein
MNCPQLGRPVTPRGRATMSASLSVVASNPSPEAGEETLSERIRRLQAEAQAMARMHIEALEEKLCEVRAISLEIAEGGAVYPVGAREIARRLVEESEARAQTLDVIVSRSTM